LKIEDNNRNAEHQFARQGCAAVAAAAAAAAMSCVVVFVTATRLIRWQCGEREDI
jgi:hypothetical protein